MLRIPRSFQTCGAPVLTVALSSRPPRWPMTLRRRDPRRLGAAWPGHLHRAISSGLPLGLSGRQQPGPRQPGRETVNVTAYAGVRALGRRRGLGRPGNGPGLRPVQHAGRGGLSPMAKAPRSARPIPICGCTGCSSARPSIWAATARTWQAQPTSWPAAAPTTMWSSPWASSRPPTSSTPMTMPMTRMHDFLNWAVIDAGAWDYAADAWGYSYGGAAEWNTRRLDACAAALFDLSRMPNGTELTRGFGQYQLDARSRAALHAVRPGRQDQAAGLRQPRPAWAITTTRWRWRWPPHQPADIALVRKALVAKPASRSTWSRG